MENSLVDPPDCRISQDTSMVSPALLSASARPHVSLPSARLRNSFRWSMQRNFEQCSPSAWPTTPGRQVRSPRLRTVGDAELTIVAFIVCDPRSTAVIQPTRPPSLFRTANSKGTFVGGFVRPAKREYHSEYLPRTVIIFGLRLVVRDSRCLRRYTLLSSDGPYCGPQAGTSLSLTGSMGRLLTSETWIETPLIFSTACCKRGMVSLKTE